ncbi:hypothetical protein [Streptomyces sp. NPDC087859]|uniref:hypothetical protein n=1 Tax=Streptomyces sp. NPDC087859 TaxID=3365812 RepID=UPI00382312F3
MLGQLDHCLTNHQKFDEVIAFDTPAPALLVAAACNGSWPNVRESRCSATASSVRRHLAGT